MTTQLSLPMPYPPGHYDRIKWQQDLCHKPKTVEYHIIKDTEAYPS